MMVVLFKIIDETAYFLINFNRNFVLDFPLKWKILNPEQKWFMQFFLLVYDFWFICRAFGSWESMELKLIFLLNLFAECFSVLCLVQAFRCFIYCVGNDMHHMTIDTLIA